MRNAYRARVRGWAATGACIGLAAVCVAATADAVPRSGQEARRREAAQRRRRIIFNNDGDDWTLGPETFLDYRTRALAGSHVDAIFYSVVRGGFNCYSTRTPSAQTIDEPRMRRFLAKGTDPLREQARFCNEQGIELFASVRMNDWHHGWWPVERFEGTRAFAWMPEDDDGYEACRQPREQAGDLEAFFSLERASRLGLSRPFFSMQRPELLLGRRHGARGGVLAAIDYGHAEVRDRMVCYIEELVRDYDLAGVELDFCRHTMFFGKVAWGGEAGQEEWDQMTDMLRRIREAMLRQERLRGRPFLLAIRVKDDPEFNRRLGLDVETWLREGWIDLLVVSEYFRFRPWEDSVALARRHGVQVYACLSDTRIGRWRDATEAEKEAGRMRMAPESYRGRALNAWDAGVDGIYLFNLFDPRLPQWRELGEPLLLERLDKDYFASVRGVGINRAEMRHPEDPGRRVGVPHLEFFRTPTLNPRDPVLLHPGEEQDIPLRTGEELVLSRGRRADWSSLATIRNWLDPILIQALVSAPEWDRADDLRVTLNGVPLPAPVRGEGSWWVFDPLPEGALHKGWNTFSFTWQGSQPIELHDLLLRVRYPPLRYSALDD